MKAMSKKTEEQEVSVAEEPQNTETTGTAEAPAPVQEETAAETQTGTEADPYAELLQNGKAILSAKSLEELEEMINNIPADSKYIVGAIGRSCDKSTFTIQVDLVKS